jgi:hypothetical protein
MPIFSSVRHTGKADSSTSRMTSSFSQAAAPCSGDAITPAYLLGRLHSPRRWVADDPPDANRCASGKGSEYVMCAAVGRECLRRRQVAFISPPASVQFHELPSLIHHQALPSPLRPPPHRRCFRVLHLKPVRPGRMRAWPCAPQAITAEGLARPLRTPRTSSLVVLPRQRGLAAREHKQSRRSCLSD